MGRTTLQKILDKLPTRLPAQFEKTTGIKPNEVWEHFPASYIGTAYTADREWEFTLTYNGNIKKGSIKEVTITD